MSTDAREVYLERMRSTLAGLTRCPHGVVRETTACHICEVAAKAAERPAPPSEPPAEPEPQPEPAESESTKESADVQPA